MLQLTRVDPNEDPYLALRTALGVAFCVVLAEPFGIQQPMLPVAFALALMSNQRGALNPRTFAGPLAIPVIAVVFSWLAAITVNEPLLFMSMNIVFAIAGIAIMLFRGSRGGMMLTVFPLMMSMSALSGEYVLAGIRDSLIMGGIAAGAAIVLFNIILPPQTNRIELDEPGSFETAHPKKELFIRSAVYIAVMMGTYATGDMNLMVAPIMMVFICAEPDHDGRLQQLVDRGASGLIGAAAAILIMAIYYVVPDLPILVCLMVVLTYFFIDKMSTGRARPLFYQNVCSVMLILTLSSTYGSRDAFEVVFQRVSLTMGIMLSGIALLSLLEALFLPRDEPLPHLPVV